LSNKNKTYLVTGGSGFIGLRLCNAIQSSGGNLQLILRKKNKLIKCKQFIMNLDSEEIDNNAFLNVDTVFHLAGYAHDTNKTQSEEKYRRVNIDFTLQVARLAIKNKVKKFIFISSVKAGGEIISDRCQNENDQNESNSLYGKTKRFAELELLNLCRDNNIHISIIRPSLVYGPGVKGNLKIMLKAIKKGWFPPLPEIGNKRSMIHVDDLVKAILFLSNKDLTNGEIYIATDGKQYSSREIYKTICNVLDKPIPKWTIPKFVFKIAALISPQMKYKVDKLIGNECYNSGKLQELGFKPGRELKEINETYY
jgi:UDP-glucose 4-epimerase